MNGLNYHIQVNSDWTEFPFYFKAGAYVIDHDGPETEGGWVVYESFNVQQG
ncbi:hypothetical protein D3C75_1380630 [compost metagenome]